MDTDTSLSNKERAAIRSFFNDLGQALYTSLHPDLGFGAPSNYWTVAGDSFCNMIDTINEAEVARMGA